MIQPSKRVQHYRTSSFWSYFVPLLLNVFAKLGFQVLPPCFSTLMAGYLNGALPSAAAHKDEVWQLRSALGPSYWGGPDAGSCRVLVGKSSSEAEMSAFCLLLLSFNSKLSFLTSWFWSSSLFCLTMPNTFDRGVSWIPSFAVSVLIAVPSIQMTYRIKPRCKTAFAKLF